MNRIKLLIKIIWHILVRVFEKITRKKFDSEFIITPEKRPENVEIINDIKIMAFVIGMSKSQVEIDIRKELTGDNLELAIHELNRVFQDYEKIPRVLIRKYRKENGLSFSKLVKQRMK